MKAKPPKPVNIHDAKTHLSRLLKRVARGEEVVIAKAGTPIAKIVPIAPKLEPRKSGLWAEAGVWVADDFDETPKEIIDLFYDAPLDHDPMP